ncbi:MAG: glycoside hydrolase family 31 protein [Anaerolineales bacterium]|jgi:hypothetical protein
MSGRNQVVVGAVRVQALSKTLVRVEGKGTGGFEDRLTFTVVNRDWEGDNLQLEKQDGRTILETNSYRIIIPAGGHSLDGVRVETIQGEPLYQYNGEIPPFDYLPNPSETISTWVMADNPRLIPPPWGATPPPIDYMDSPTSGWDLENDAPDIYVFIPGDGGYEQLVWDFLKLTGPIPLPSLYLFGLIDSRYHPYDETTALETIDTYREKGIPLDVFVMDTDWRVGASHGYTINEKLFPDMEQFIDNVHRRGLYLLYNDHPEPKSPGGLIPEELSYRYEGLTSLLKIGADIWWYDRNWMTHIETPVDGLPRDVWGQRLYHDITERFRPEKRPVIMSNVAGIEHGKRIFPAHPAEHRYPIWWTGDTYAQWDYLRWGIENGVDYGILGLMPYVNEDLGGHIGDPGPELYVRFVQFGVFSPVTRLHCTRHQTRYPWAFGDQAEKITREYIRLRYRLLPTIYAAARRAYDDGTPILRRNDLYWPEYPQAADSSQYLFGEDLLVAPVNTGQSDFAIIGAEYLKTSNGDPGLIGEYYSNPDFQGDAVYTQVDPKVSFSWGFDQAPVGVEANGFSIRWCGRLEDIPESGEYIFGLYLSGIVRMWLDDDLLFDLESNDISQPVMVNLELAKGASYDLRLEYIKKDGWAAISLTWIRPSKAENTPARNVWLPPGIWIDTWSGARLQGPCTMQISSELWHTPLYVREGGVIFSLPQTLSTSEEAWSTVVVDAFLTQGVGRTRRLLYEDDGISTAYQEGEFCRTPVTLEYYNKNIYILRIDKIDGDYQGKLGERSWVIRLHLPKGKQPRNVTIDGKALFHKATVEETEVGKARIIDPGQSVNEMPFRGPGSAPRPKGGVVLEVILPRRSTDRQVELKMELLG